MERKLMATQVLAWAMCVGHAGAQPCGEWVQRLPDEAPSARDGHVMAYDTAREVGVLFGPDKNSETWEWDGKNWALKWNKGFPPGGRGESAAAYDIGRAVTVLFGGYCCGGVPENDLNEWNGSTWVYIDLPMRPRERAEHAMVYDPNRGAALMFGGHYFDHNAYISVFLGDTWEYDGQAWTQLSDEGPAPRFGHAMAYDSKRGVAVLFGGYLENGNTSDETWEWNGASWTLADVGGPGPRALHAMAYDSDRGVTVLFGGQNGDQQLRGDTWEWDGQSWKEVTPLNGPKRREFHAMAYDPARKAIIMFGGKGDSGLMNDTWEFRCTPPPCYPDLDGNGTLDLFDYLAFVNLFNNPHPTADCDQSGSLDLFDFLCFVNAFNAGC